ncbi:(5-formylfuran-3-yl)methyl phosphate synthase [Symmachiella dynata]|uniref:(5-formylfuran-3-yl)methyl phosphate synthase n=1 Tax=Symmachiella dynata TaxID=2527995 RepID=UPI0030ECD57A
MQLQHDDQPLPPATAPLSPAESHPSMPPQLLVSVRNGIEAEAALQGGCDILDIKEPARGSLGMADVAAISAVADVVRQQQVDVVVSTALGETTDWYAAAPPALPAGINYAKLGTAGLRPDLDWRRRWSEVRRQFDLAADRNIAWIAVAYIDWELANSPPPLEIVAAATEAGCAGVLFDTFTKTGRGLFDWLSKPQLHALVNDIHAAGQLVAVAGQITAENVPALIDFAPDIIAIRSAACAGGQRTNSIEAEAIRHFKTAMHNAAISH